MITGTLIPVPGDMIRFPVFPGRLLAPRCESPPNERSARSPYLTWELAWLSPRKGATLPRLSGGTGHCGAGALSCRADTSRLKPPRNLSATETAVLVEAGEVRLVEGRLARVELTRSLESLEWRKSGVRVGGVARCVDISRHHSRSGLPLSSCSRTLLVTPGFLGAAIFRRASFSSNVPSPLPKVQRTAA